MWLLLSQGFVQSESRKTDRPVHYITSKLQTKNAISIFNFCHIHSKFCVFCIQEIKEYLVLNGAEQVLTENQTNGCLKENTRKKFINCLCEFVVARFGEYPDKDKKTSVSVAAVTLLPCLKFKESAKDGIVCTFVVNSRYYQLNISYISLR